MRKFILMLALMVAGVISANVSNSSNEESLQFYVNDCTEVAVANYDLNMSLDQGHESSLKIAHYAYVECVENGGTPNEEGWPGVSEQLLR